MTREEAITLLQSRVDLIKKDYPGIADYVEALEMAIEALNHIADADKKVSSSCGQENDKSIIYRQAVIDWLKNEWNGMVTSLFDGIKALPSAQPEQKKGKWIKTMRVTETEKYISYDPDWYCACCGAKYDPHIAKIVNFCYVCGADMRGEQDE